MTLVNQIIPFNSLPNNKILEFSKLKRFAYDKINETHRKKIVSVGVENIAGKGESTVYQHFLHFPQCIKKASF